MKVVIVEDNLLVADNLKDMLEKHGVTVSDVCVSYEEAVKCIGQYADLFLIDIRLSGDKTGIDLGKELQKNQIPFVYVTANNELQTMKLAAQTAPLSYLSKPYKEVDILAIIEVFKSTQDATITVKTEYGKTNISLSQLLFIEAKGSYVNIVTGDKTFTERANLNEFENYHPNLIRTHRSFIVNKNQVTQLNSSVVYINNLTIPISRSFKQEVFKKFNI